jgi:hypothetical protein
MLNGHRRFVQERYISVEEFQRLVENFAGDQTVARRKLIEHIRKEFRRRGIEMSCATIEERFRSNPSVRTIPRCVKQIFEDLGQEYRTGLIPIEKMVGEREPEQWLEQTREKLDFRSHSSMHKAIAEATDLTYDCIHKALSGSEKAKRIQRQIKICLEDWLEAVERGEDLEVDDDYRGIPVEQVAALMPGMLEAFDSKEAVYRAISDRTGLRPGSIRRYFQSDGRLKFAPLSVYRAALRLGGDPAQDVDSRNEEPAVEDAEPIQQESISDLSARLERISKRRDAEAERNLRKRFKSLRLALIKKLASRRASAVACCG